MNSVSEKKCQTETWVRSDKQNLC